jgi:hypothetical protein
MVLLKHEEDDFIECLYDSSNVLGSKFLKKEKKLAVIFKSGTQYVYNNVTNEDYKQFESSDSQGKLLNTVIKKYTFEKSKNIIDVSPMLEQINVIKNTI